MISRAENKISIELDERNKEIQGKLLFPLIEYIRSKRKEILTKEDEQKIANELCSCLIDNTYSGDYSEYICSFIVLNEHNKEIQNLINIIIDGCVLETGLRYHGLPAISQYATRELVVYLDTEIIFSCWGLNGDLSKRIFDSFLEQVKAINNQTVKKYNHLAIRLRYIPLTRDEINHYFHAAEKLIEENRFDSFPREAMKNIIEQCYSPSDVMALKATLFNKLDSLNIEIAGDVVFDAERCKNYILNDLENIKWISNLFNITQEEAYEHLNILTLINALRAGRGNVPVEESGFLFLSGKNIRLAIAAKIFEMQGGCYLVSTLEWLTNRLWYKLNRGIGMSRPLTLNAVVTAKTILSTRLNVTLAAKFKEFQENQKQLTEEENLAALAGFREKMHFTDEINAENVAEIQDTLISDENYNSFIERHNNLKKENEFLQKEKLELEQYRKIKSVILRSIQLACTVCSAIFLILSAVWILSLYFKNREYIDFLCAPLVLAATLITLCGFLYEIGKNFFRRGFFLRRK